MRMKQSRIISGKLPVKNTKNKAASPLTPRSCAIRTCISVIYTQIQKNTSRYTNNRIDRHTKSIRTKCFKA